MSSREGRVASPGRDGADDAPRRSPLANPANALTLLRVALVPVIMAAVASGGPVARAWALGLFLLAAVTDTVDGWLARRLVGPTRWGQLADPAADKALVIGTLGVLAARGELSWWPVVIVVLREVAVTVQRQRLLRRDVVMPASSFGKAKTVSQVLAIGVLLLPSAPGAVEAVLLGVALVLTVASGLDYVGRGRRLARAG